MGARKSWHHPDLQANHRLQRILRNLRLAPKYNQKHFQQPRPGNWSAYVPDLPGCIATGKTLQETEHQIREAIEFHIQGLRQLGETIPEPSIEAGKVSVSTS